MSQSVVNFIIDNPLLAGYNPVTEPRIFDFEITDDAVAFYVSQMNNLRALLEAQANSTSPIPDATLIEISDTIKVLNDWSKLRVVATVPVVDKGTGIITGTTTAQTYLINGNVMPVDLDGNVLTVQFTGNTMDVDSNNRVTILADALPAFTSGATTLNSTMDRYMAEEFDKLLRTFRAAGWDPVFTPISAGSSAADKTLASNAVVSLANTNRAVFGVLDDGASKGILTRAVEVANQARVIGRAAETQSQSIQQVLMVDYISRGNELLFNEMSKLRDAIDTNQTVLQYLNSLQDLMNQKDPERFILQLQYLNNIVAAVNPQALYDQFETESFNQALGTVSRITSDDPSAILQYFATLAENTTVANLSDTDVQTVTDKVLSLLGLDAIDADPTAPVTARSALQAYLATQVASYLATYNGDLADFTYSGVSPVYYVLARLGLAGGVFVNGPGLFPPYLNLDPDFDTPPQYRVSTPSIVTDLPTLQSRITTWLPGDPYVAAHSAEIAATLQSLLSQVVLDEVNGVPAPSLATNGTFVNALITSNYSGAATLVLPTSLEEQPEAIEAFIAEIVAANGTTGIPGITATNLTTVADGLTTLIPSGLTAAQLTYLHGTVIPGLASAIVAANTDNPISTTNPPSVGAFEELKDALATIFNFSKQQIIDNLDYLMGQIAATGANAGQPLSIALTKIKADFLNVSSIKDWIEDTEEGTEGDFQRHLNNGLVASQSFNDTQREELSRVMFVFEEFYKSATGLLSRLTQLIEKMATAIAR